MKYSQPTSELLQTFIAVDIFKSFNKKNIRYTVLRGYQNLPFYSNDIDIGINQSDAHKALKIIKDLVKENGGSFQVEKIRLGVSRNLIQTKKETLKLDIWFDINYAGLRYVDCENLYKHREESNGIWILRPDYELAISYLKELLHNSKIRKEKVDTLKEKLSLHTPDAFDDFFPRRITSKFIKSITGNNYKLKNLSIQAKIYLLFSNIQNRGIITTAKSLIRFYKIRRSSSNDIQDALRILK